MKINIGILLLLFAMPLFAQDGGLHNWTITVTLDSTDTEVRYLYFWNKSGLFDTNAEGFTATAATPPKEVFITDNLLITGYIDSLKANTAKDSTTIKVEPLDKDGYPLAAAVLWFDFADHDTVASAQQISAFIPFNRTTPTLGVTNPTFWVDLTGLIKATYGLKFTLLHTGDGATNDCTSVKLNVAQGFKN